MSCKCPDLGSAEPSRTYSDETFSPRSLSPLSCTLGSDYSQALNVSVEELNAINFLYNTNLQSRTTLLS